MANADEPVGPRDTGSVRGLVGSLAGACVMGLLLGSLDFLFGLNAGGWNRPGHPGLIWQAFSFSVLFFFILGVLLTAIAGLLMRGLRVGAGGRSVLRLCALLALLGIYTSGTFILNLSTLEPSLIQSLAYVTGGGTVLALLLTLPVAWNARRKREGSAGGAERAWRLLVAAAGAAVALAMAVWLGVSGWLEVGGGLSYVLAGGLFVVVWTLMRGLQLWGGEAVVSGGYVVGFLLLVLLPHAFAALPEDTPPRHPGTPPGVRRIVLITIDTLRADALSCYGDEGTSTPHLDELAGRGVRFENATSAASWTLPSFASIMTGFSVATHEVLLRESPLPASAVTLAEQLQAAGYATGAFGMNPYLRSGRGFEKGFDVYDFYPQSIETIETPFDASLGARLVNRTRTLLLSEGVSSREIADLALGWMDDRRDEPFFLWCHFFDPHLPYAPPPEFYPEGEPAGRVGERVEKVDVLRSSLLDPTAEELDWLKALYLAEVRYVDRQVGRLLDAVDRLGPPEETLILLASDHGEEFWEHGGFEHGHTLYQEVLHVPLMVAYPDRIEPAVEARRVSVEAILPTILDLASLPSEPGPESAPLFTPSEPGVPLEEAIFAAGILYGPPREAVFHEGWKFSRRTDGSEARLFNLEEDPGEMSDQLEVDPQRGEELAGLLVKKEHRAGELRDALNLETGRTIELPEEVLDSLKDLGYL